MKRGLDIVISVVVLACVWPVILLACLIIRLTSPGPVLFRQQRMGRGFLPFEILKLRTMAHNEAGLAYTLGPDPRITPFGKFLRRSKIDELPQLWNVLRGEMSVVGPRPVLPELTAEFRVHYVLLLRVRPGLTDPASLKYSQEASMLAMVSEPMRFFKTVVTPDKLRISIEYMEHANVWTDLKTMAMTAVICCFPRLSRIYGATPWPLSRSDGWRTYPLPQPKPLADLAFLVARASVTPARFDTRPLRFETALTSLVASAEGAAEMRPQVDDMPWIRIPISHLTQRNRPLRPRQDGLRL